MPRVSESQPPILLTVPKPCFFTPIRGIYTPDMRSSALRSQRLDTVLPYLFTYLTLPYLTLAYLIFLSFSTKGMTGPTGNLLSSSGSVSHIPSLPLGLDNGLRDVLAKNTIDLHDTATIWPSRSLERRRAFQHLLSRCIEIMRDLLDQTTLTYDLDTTDRFCTDAKIHVVKRPHVLAARNE